MFCPQCGAPNEDEAIFCGNCGAVLNADEAPAGEALAIPTEETFEEPLFEDYAVDQPVMPTPPPPPPRYSTTTAPASSGLAIASLLLGIGGLTILPLIGSILALIFGYMARKDIRNRPAEVGGDGMALAGIVMGWIAVGLSVLGIIAGVGFFACGMCGTLGSGSY